MLCSYSKKRSWDKIDEKSLQQNHKYLFHKNCIGCIKIKQEYLKGYIDGFREALEVVGSDLCEELFETPTEYGESYLINAEFIKNKDCLNCEEPMKEDCFKVVGIFCPLCSKDM